jgi:hypothetical protein
MFFRIFWDTFCGCCPSYSEEDEVSPLLLSRDVNYRDSGGISRIERKEEDLMVAESESFWVEGNKSLKYLDDQLYPSSSLENFKEENQVHSTYRDLFVGKSHLHFLGKSQTLGLVCISTIAKIHQSSNENATKVEVLALIRWEKTDTMLTMLLDLASILSFSSSFWGSSILEGPSSNVILQSQYIDTNKLFRYLQRYCPDLAHLEVSSIFDENHQEFNKIQTKLEEFENSVAIKNLKVGVLYCAEKQTKEKEMYFNCQTSHHFENFLKLLGEPFVCEEKKGIYYGGLHQNQEGIRSVWGGIDFVFHVSSMLAFDPTEESQQIERKRHIGNDTIVLVFVEGQQQISPVVFRSKVNLIFIFIRLSTLGKYHVQVVSKTDLEPFDPKLPDDDLVFEPNENFRNFLFSKIVNGNISAFMSAKYKHYWYARQEALGKAFANCT